jgi:taurine dioxygenase
MPIEITPLTHDFGAEIRNLDASAALSAHDAEQLKDAFYKYSVLVLRRQDLSTEAQEQFTRHFGTPTIHVLDQYLHASNPAVLVISNIVGDNGQTVGLDEGDVVEWHSDLFWHQTPSVGSLLHAIAVPPHGGDTLFASMYAAYERLEPRLRDKLLGRTAVRSLHQLTERERERNPSKPPLTPEQQELAPPVSHPVVRIHPITRRRSLFLSEMAIHSIAGMSAEASDELVNELIAEATRPECIYRHRWRKGDLIIWDNRCTIHTRTPSDARYPRILHRTTLEGEAVLAAG